MDILIFLLRETTIKQIILIRPTTQNRNIFILFLQKYVYAKAQETNNKKKIIFIIFNTFNNIDIRNEKIQNGSSTNHGSNLLDKANTNASLIFCLSFMFVCLFSG